MADLGPKSIRGKTVLTAVVLSALAMALIVAAVAFGMLSSLRAALLATLDDRLAIAAEHVEAGDFERAADQAGSVLVVVLDENGSVVTASSESAAALDFKSLIADKRGHDFEIDDLDDADDARERDDDDADDADDKRPAAPASPSTIEGTKTPSTPAAPPASSTPSAGASSSEPSAAPSSSASSPSYDDTDDAYDSDDYDNDYDEPDYDYDEPDYDSDGDDDYDDDDLANRIAPRLARTILSPILAAQEQAPLSESRLSQITGSNGPFLVAQRDAAFEGASYTLIAIASMEDAISSARRAAIGLAIVFCLLLAAIAWFAWIMSGRILQPVEDMRSATEKIISHDLSSRIPIPEQDPDLSPLAATFNEVISRMEADLDSQRRFISDASHELKSPVAASALILDTLAANPAEAATPETIADLRRENGRMQSIVSDLLALARYDEGAAFAELAPCDVIDIVLEQVATVRARSAKTFDVSRVEPVIARVDQRLLSHALANLLDNAERFSKSMVRVGCSAHDGIMRISVEDDGPGISEQDRERVFDRFVRLDQTAEGAKSSTGLGLAVVKAVAQAHGGRAYFTTSELGGAQAVLELPHAE